LHDVLRACILGVVAQKRFKLLQALYAPG